MFSSLNKALIRERNALVPVAIEKADARNKVPLTVTKVAGRSRADAILAGAAVSSFFVPSRIKCAAGTCFGSIESYLRLNANAQWAGDSAVDCAGSGKNWFRVEWKGTRPGFGEILLQMMGTGS